MTHPVTSEQVARFSERMRAVKPSLVTVMFRTEEASVFATVPLHDPEPQEAPVNYTYDKSGNLIPATPLEYRGPVITPAMILAFIGLVALLAIVVFATGCSTAPPPVAPSIHKSPEPDTAAEPMTLPSWVVSPPSTNNSLSGVGISSYQKKTHIQLAAQHAATMGRRAIADSLYTTIQGVTKSYMRQVSTDMGDVAEESLVQDVTRAVTDTALSGAVVVQSYIDQKEGIVYVLVSLGFESIAENLHNEMASRVEAVKKRSDEAFKELDTLLAQELEKQNAKAAANNPAQ